MQQTLKAVSIFLFATFLLISCGGVAPVVPTSTPALKKTLSPSATLATRQTPTYSPTPIPTSTPTSSLSAFQPSDFSGVDVSQYKLRPWLEHDYGYILSNVEKYKDIFKIPYFKIGDYMAVFQSERLLRFPDSSESGTRLWNLLLAKPDIKIAPDTQPGQDLMGFLISNFLEQGVPLTGLKAELEKQEELLIDVIDTPNLLGTGEQGMVMQITVTGVGDRVMAVYAITQDHGKYQINAITPWTTTNYPGYGIYYELHGIGDTNQNGLSEFVIQEQTGASGMPQVWSETILHVEWSKDEERFTVNRIPVFNQTCDEFGGGPCEGDWEFSSVNSKSTLTTHSYWSTRGNCPELIVQKKSVWDGRKYLPGQPNVILPQDIVSPECRLAWAETAFSLGESIYGEDAVAPGWKNEQVISTVEESVKNWTPEMAEIWGPAGADYFKLRLAIWHDLRGEDERAAEILEELTGNPQIENYNFISRMANTYLQIRGRKRKTQACLAIQAAYSEELSKISSESPMYNNDEWYLEHWGVVDWKGPLCDADEMLASSLSTLSKTSPKDIRNYLKESGGYIYYDERSDLNNDNTKDYLALVEFDDSDNIDAWAFLNVNGGIKAQLVNSFYSEQNQPKLKVRTIQTGDELIHLISVGDELIMARFLADSSPKLILDEYGVQDFKVIEDVSPLRVVLDVDNFLDGQATKMYQWDGSTKEFASLDVYFDSVQTNIEKMIYDKHDYASVIKYIDQFLSTAPRETPSWYECGVDIPEGCNYLPEWYAPYFRYMRGLAYEQLGDEEQAKQTYYELWKDFPNHVFGVAASLKLEPINP